MLLIRDPRNRDHQLPVRVLMIKRDDTSMLLPDADTRLQCGDEILIAGQAQVFICWITDNHNVLRSGVETPCGLVRRWPYNPGRR